MFTGFIIGVILAVVAIAVFSDGRLFDIFSLEDKKEKSFSQVKKRRYDNNQGGDADTDNEENTEDYPQDSQIDDYVIDPQDNDHEEEEDDLFQEENEPSPIVPPVNETQASDETQEEPEEEGQNRFHKDVNEYQPPKFLFVGDKENDRGYVIMDKTRSYYYSDVNGLLIAKEGEKFTCLLPTLEGKIKEIESPYARIMFYDADDYSWKKVTYDDGVKATQADSEKLYRKAQALIETTFTSNKTRLAEIMEQKDHLETIFGKVLLMLSYIVDKTTDEDNIFERLDFPHYLTLTLSVFYKGKDETTNAYYKRVSTNKGVHDVLLTRLAQNEVRNKKQLEILRQASEETIY